MNAQSIASMSAPQVEARLLASLRSMEAAQHDAVSCFGEILERRLYRHFGCSSMPQYTRERLGFSAGKTSEFLRLWEAFKCLPRLKEAVDSGKVGWTKAREVIRVATPRTEAAWVEDATALSRNDLLRKVNAVRGDARRRRRAPGQGELGMSELPAPDGAGDEPDIREVPVILSLRLSPEQYARYEALLEKVRQGGVRGSREETLLAALELMAAEGRSSAGAKASESNSVSGCSRKAAGAPSNAGARAGAPLASPPPRYQIVVHVCEQCRRAELPTDRGALSIDAATLATAACDARVQRPGERNRATIPPSVRRQVLARDGHRCASAGCRSTRFLDVHHVVPRSAGGSNDPSNLVTLCGACHRLVHARDVRFGGTVSVPRRDGGSDARTRRGGIARIGSGGGIVRSPGSAAGAATTDIGFHPGEAPVSESELLPGRRGSV